MPIRLRVLAVVLVTIVLSTVLAWPASHVSVAAPEAPAPIGQAPEPEQPPLVSGEPPAIGSSTPEPGPELVTFDAPPAAPESAKPVPVSTSIPDAGTVVGFVEGESVETVDARDVGSRTFVNPDGSRTLEMSTEPLNYKDGSGRWTAIDNRLITARDGSVSNAANEWDVNFGPLSAGVAVATAQGPVFGWRPRGARANVSPTIEPDGLSVRYVDAWPGVDLVYRVSGSTVKELIEVKNASARAIFEFDVRGAGFTGDSVKGWTASAVKDGTVRMLPPLSFDGKGTGVDNRVSVDVSASAPGADDAVPAVKGRAANLNQVVRFGLDATWLRELPAEQFPITIDPDVLIPPSCCPNWDPSVAYKADGTVTPGPMRIGNPLLSPTSTAWWRSVVSFNTTQYPALTGATILGANLWVDAQPVGTGWQPIYGYVASTWAWQNPSGSPVIWDSINADNPSPQDLGNSTALTALYQSWVNSGTFGALLLTGGETVNSYTLVSAPVQLRLTYNRPPTSATSGLLSPTANATSHNLTQTFTAGVGSDPDGDALTYEFYYCTSQSCSAGQYTMGTTTNPTAGVTATLPSNFPTQSFYWGVRVSDGIHQWVDMAAASRRLISFANQQPTASLISPVNNTLLVPGSDLVLRATISDPDGDAVNYRFKVSPNSGSGLLLSMPYQQVASGTTVEFTLPNGLTSLQGYLWTVETNDIYGAVGAAQSRTIVLQSRLGSSTVAPMQAAGPVSVNLATGNLVFAAGTSRSMTTVGGSVGAAFVYNSQDRSNQGLRAVYREGSSVKLSRVDPMPSFQWGSGSPGYSVNSENFTAEWTGYMRLPTMGGTTHSWKFAGGHDDALKITINGTVVYDSTSPVTLGDPNVFNGATAVGLADGALVSIRVEYTEVTGNAAVEFRAMADNAERLVTQDWFTITAPVLPTGWTFSADTGLSARWIAAKVNEDNVTLTAADGQLVSFARKAGTGTQSSVIAWEPPPTEDDIVNVNQATGEVTVHSSEGYDYSFDKNGLLLSVVTAADALKPAGAVIVMSAGTTSTNPLKITELGDRLDPGVPKTRRIRFFYNQPGLDPCPTAVAGFDASAPVGMLCRIVYPDGTETRLYYQAGLVARISDPGDETPNPAPEGRAVTDLRWDQGRIAQVWTVSANDRIAAQNAVGSTIPVGERITAEDLDTEIGWQPGSARPSTITQPRPIIGQSRPATTFVFGSSTASVTIAGLTGTARTVTFDAAGRTLTDTDAVGRATSYQWANDADIILSTTAGGRRTTTIFDSETRSGWHPTDTYGPAPTACFGTDRRPVANPAGTAGCGIAQIPHTKVDYDHNIKGLQGKYWPSATPTGAPAGYGMGPSPSGNGNVDYVWPNTTIPPGLTGADNWSARFTGLVYPPTTGNYTVTLTSGATDTATVYIDDAALVKTVPGATTDSNAGFGLTAGRPVRVRIDFQAGTGTSSLQLSFTPSGGSANFLGNIAKPGFFYATRSTVDDTTGSPQVPATTVTETRFDEGIDPVYGIATSTTLDPTGLGLKTTTAYETPGTGSLLRRTRRTLPAFATAPSSANSISYTYYGDTETRANPCVGGSAAVLQAGLPKQTTSPTPATGTAITTETVYDILGRPVATRYVPDTAWTCTTYDTRGRIIAITYPADTIFTSGRTITTTYRAGGDPYRTTISDGAVTGSTNGSTITTVTDALGRPVASTDVWNQTATTTYDQAGRVTSTNGPTGSFTYTYDNVGRLTNQYMNGAVIATPTYTPDTAALDPGVMYDVTYPSTGAGNGTRGVITRDTLGRITGLTWTRVSNSALITSDTVTRSLTGKVLTTSIDGATTPAWTYTYDGAGRLNNAVGSGHNYVYGYGTASCGANTAAGRNTNRTTLTDNGTNIANYCYDNADRLTSTTQANYTGTITYDNHGNTTVIGGDTHRYDYANRHLATYTPNPTTPTSSVIYTRDALDNIVARTATWPSGTESHRYSHGAVLDTTNTIIERSIPLPGGVSLTIRGSTPPPPTSVGGKTFDSTAEGMVSWYNSTLAIDTTTKRTGNGSLKITSSSPWFGVVDMTGTPQSVTGGTHYTFSMYSRAATTGANVNIVVRWLNSNWEQLGYTYAVPGGNDTTGTWTQLSASMVAPADAAMARIGLQINGSASGEIHYIDDYTLTSSAVTTATVNAKGFETTTDNMTSTSAATVAASTAQAKTGTRSLAITPTGAWVVTDGTSGIAVSPSSTYRLSGWVKLASGSGTMSVKVDWYNASNGWLRSDDIVEHENLAVWASFTTHNMMPPAGAAYAKTRLAGPSGAVWYIDDLTLATIVPTSSTQIWSYPNIHGDVQAIADATGSKQGNTHIYDPYGGPLTTTPDNIAGGIDATWLGQHNRWNEKNTGSRPVVQMGARPYDPSLGRFLEVDPVHGGSCNDYDYSCSEPVNMFDLDGRKPCSTQTSPAVFYVTKYGRARTNWFARPNLLLSRPVSGAYVAGTTSKCVDKAPPRYVSLAERASASTGCSAGCVASTTSRIVEDAIGCAQGAPVGTMYGAGIGSFVPFVGNAFGAVVGGVVGCGFGIAAQEFMNGNFPP